jgi:catechol 2,3-dioxygenase-like lactoylglutathione lyase family enzyme
MLELADPRTHDWSRPTVDHVHLRVADLDRSRAFYRAALEPLGVPFLLDAHGLLGFGNLALSADAPPTVGAHVAFVAETREAVDAFHAAAIAAGGTDNGAPGPRPHAPYAAFVLDPDGVNLEAVCRVGQWGAGG